MNYEHILTDYFKTKVKLCDYLTDLNYYKKLAGIEVKESDIAECKKLKKEVEVLEHTYAGFLQTKRKQELIDMYTNEIYLHQSFYDEYSNGDITFYKIVKALIENTYRQKFPETDEYFFQELEEKLFEEE